MTIPWPEIDPSKLVRPDFAPLTTQATESTGLIYFYGSDNGKRIKIGWTQQPKQRKTTHGYGDAFGEGGRFEVLALLRGCRADETRLKQYFRHARIPGPRKEVFRPDAVIPYLVWLRDQYFVSTSYDELFTESGQIVIDSSVWLPSKEKVSDRRSTGLFADIGPWSFLPNRQRTADDWYTPQELMEPIRAALGGTIDLDPATHVIANQVVRAKRIYTHAQSGLSHPWRGTVFLNPPFDDWQLWADRAEAEWERGEITAMVMLGFTRTMTAKYFAPTLGQAEAMAIVKGRYGFWGRDTDSMSAPDGVFLLYRGPDCQMFVECLRPLASWCGLRA